MPGNALYRTDQIQPALDPQFGTAIYGQPGLWTGNGPGWGQQGDGQGQQANPFPAWLTDLSARGIAGDWAADAHLNPDVINLTPGPTSDPTLAAPAVAPVAPVALSESQIQPGLSNPSGGGPDGGGGENSSGNGGESGGGGGGGNETAAGGGEAGNGGAENFAAGGVVTRNKLTGPNPPGPDNGYASIQSGEGVLTRAALKHYGPGIVARLNKLLVPKGALR